MKQDAAKDIASIETNAEMSMDQMDARRECLHFETGFQSIALLAPIAPLIGCYVDPETWRASMQTFHRHTTIAWEEASLGQGATENAIGVVWAALPASLRFYFPAEVQAYATCF